MLLADREKYPIVKIPSKIRQTLNEDPTHQEIFWSWVKRTYTENSYTYFPESKTWQKNDLKPPPCPQRNGETNNVTQKITEKRFDIDYYLIGVPLIILLPCCFIFLTTFDIKLTLAIFAGIYSLVVIFSKRPFYYTSIKEKTEKIKKSSEQLQKDEYEYQQRLLKHKKKLEENFKLALQDKKLVESELSFEKKNLKEKKYRESLKATLRPVFNQNPVQRGRFEIDFLKLLHEKFGGWILCDQKVLIKNEYFYPDFVLSDHPYEMCFDIEIDEPYSIIEKKPIHFTTCGDKDRDNFFLQNNWIVIRFTERQVKETPQECVNFIDSIRKSVINKMDKIDLSIKEENKWTYEQALLWAKDGYRNTY